MTEIIESRRTSSNARLLALQADLGEAEKLADGVACIYVTGSFGRAEAGDYSDVDAFIVGKTVGEGGNKKSALSERDEDLLKKVLIKACGDHNFPEFDRGGDFLNQHTVDHLIETLGQPEDDVENTFTARLLLLLESRPLVGEAVYHEIVDKVVNAYWRDYEKHTDNFMPMYLANDILRMWRTFCINYEARTESEPEAKLAKRKVKNYKLKHSRLLTCYSAIAYLLAVHNDSGTVSPVNALKMIGLTPTERLERIGELAPESRQHVDSILKRYTDFLNETNISPEELKGKFAQSETEKPFKKVEGELGKSMYELLNKIGKGTDFFRLLVV